MQVLEAADQAMSKNGFPQKLRQLRKERKLSQTELGKLVGLHYTHIGRYERGVSKPSQEAVERLSEALGIDVEELSVGVERAKLAVRNGFAKRLCQLRKQKNLSQSDLGERVGLHYTHIGRYERGISRPTADTLKRLADALEVSADYLIEGSIKDAAKAHFEDRELLRQFQAVEKLSEHDKDVIKTLLDAFLTKKQIQAIVTR